MDSFDLCTICTTMSSTFKDRKTVPNSTVPFQDLMWISLRYNQRIYNISQLTRYTKTSNSYSEFEKPHFRESGTLNVIFKS